MLNAMFNLLFGCAHRKTTFPLTAGRSRGAAYVVCLDCGAEFEYDWKQMRIGKAMAARGVAAGSEPVLEAVGLGRRFFA
jgi:hypothetical protein